MWRTVPRRVRRLAYVGEVAVAPLRASREKRTTHRLAIGLLAGLVLYGSSATRADGQAPLPPPEPDRYQTTLAGRVTALVYELCNDPKVTMTSGYIEVIVYLERLALTKVVAARVALEVDENGRISNIGTYMSLGIPQPPEVRARMDAEIEQDRTRLTQAKAQWAALQALRLSLIGCLHQPQPGTIRGAWSCGASGGSFGLHLNVDLTATGTYDSGSTTYDVSGVWARDGKASGRAHGENGTVVWGGTIVMGGPGEVWTGHGTLQFVSSESADYNCYGRWDSQP